MLPATTDKKVLRLALLSEVINLTDSTSGTYEIQAIWPHPWITGLLRVISRFTEALPQRDSLAPVR
jgi:hypothetical protein